MVTIQNINAQYGEPVTFSAETLEDAVAEMAAAISECGGEEWATSPEDLAEGRDFEIVDANA